MRFTRSWPLLILFACWWASSWWINDILLVPSPWQAMQALAQEMIDPKFWRAVSSSAYSLLTSWVIGMSLMIAIAASSSISQRSMYFFRYLSVIFGPLPSFAVLPVALIIFGISQVTMMVLLIFSMLWINLSGILLSVEKNLQQWGKHVSNIDLEPSRAFFLVYLPAMIPDLLVTARTSWAMAWRALLAVEVMFGNLGTGKGIGVLMMENRTMINTAEIWGTLLFIIVIGIAVSKIFDWIENSLPWRNQYGSTT